MARLAVWFGGMGHARLRMVEPLDLDVERYDKSWVPVAVLALCHLMVHADGEERPEEWDAVVEALGRYEAFSRFAAADFHAVVKRSRQGFLSLDEMLTDIRVRFARRHLHDIVSMLEEVMLSDGEEHPMERRVLSLVRERLIGDDPPPPQPEKGQPR